MRISNYKFYAKLPDGLTPISADQAGAFLSKYNVYFRIYATPNDEHGYRNFDFNNIDHNIYTLDNLKKFDDQYAMIKSINFTFDSTIYFYTDYKESESLVKRRLELASEILANKSKSVTLTNLKKETKLKDTEIKKYISSLERNPTMSLFEVGNV